MRYVNLPDKTPDPKARETLGALGYEEDPPANPGGETIGTTKKVISR